MNYVLEHTNLYLKQAFPRCLSFDDKEQQQTVICIKMLKAILSFSFKSHFKFYQESLNWKV